MIMSWGVSGIMRWRSRLSVVLILLAGGLAYANSCSGPFIFDDLSDILVNPHIRRLWPLANIFLAPPNDPVPARPIVNLTLALNYALSRYEVWGYHALNLVIHALAALVLFGLVRRTLLLPSLRQRYEPRAVWLALIAALVWVVHPLNTESVTYVIQRAEALLGLWMLLMLYGWVRGVRRLPRMSAPGLG